MNADLQQVRDFFQKQLDAHGEDAVGVGWNSAYAQEVRFEQLAKVIVPEKPYTVMDYGCGYGAMASWFRKAGYEYTHYYGYDIVEDSLKAARTAFSDDPSVSFHSDYTAVPMCDYLVASGVFNIKMNADRDAWSEYILHSLESFNKKTARGFAVNFLTSYSDPDRMAERPDLYYADPCLIFDYCRRHFSRNVALLHDYKIWDFTVIVRKEFD